MIPHDLVPKAHFHLEVMDHLETHCYYHTRLGHFITWNFLQCILIWSKANLLPLFNHRVLTPGLVCHLQPRCFPQTKSARPFLPQWTVCWTSSMSRSELVSLMIKLQEAGVIDFWKADTESWEELAQRDV